MQPKDKIIINDIGIDNTTYAGLLSEIQSGIELSKQVSVAYANANTINLTYSNSSLRDVLNSFDIVHPDGVGVYLASRYLYGKNGLSVRFNGSDFYPLLAELAAINKWKVFFFGHDDDTLSKIKHRLPDMIIGGMQNGYTYNNTELINAINSSGCDILIIGLGTPKQENWVNEAKDKLNCKVIICVGDGIKVFAGSIKRAPKFLRKSGLEWFWRLSLNPFKYFRRYVIGNPLFLYRIIRLKMRKLA
ncbi:MAG: WecB/TagA/CpsF family glycosyltransferase [Ignavibacteria bacterium]